MIFFHNIVPFLIQSLNKKIKTYGSRLNSTSTTQNEFEKPKKPANFILKINPNLIVNNIIHIFYFVVAFCFLDHLWKSVLQFG
jgi:hypothetical protein